MIGKLTKKVTVKNYAAIIKKAPKRIQVKGKATIKSFGAVGSSFGGTGGCFGGGGIFSGGTIFSNQPSSFSFIGPNLQQRLLGWAGASTIVTVRFNGTAVRGRIVSVDGNAFEMTVIDPLNSGFPPGSIVTVSLNEVNAIAASGI